MRNDVEYYYGHIAAKGGDRALRGSANAPFPTGTLRATPIPDMKCRLSIVFGAKS
jgi:hypothetical protein